MPCKDHDHFWPVDGNHTLVIELCETQCGWCSKYSTDQVTNLRAHARTHLKNAPDGILSGIKIQKLRAGRPLVQLELQHPSKRKRTEEYVPNLRYLPAPIQPRLQPKGPQPTSTEGVHPYTSSVQTHGHLGVLPNIEVQKNLLVHGDSNKSGSLTGSVNPWASTFSTSRGELPRNQPSTVVTDSSSHLTVTPSELQFTGKQSELMDWFMERPSTPTISTSSLRHYDVMPKSRGLSMQAPQPNLSKIAHAVTSQRPVQSSLTSTEQSRTGILTENHPGNQTVAYEQRPGWLDTLLEEEDGKRRNAYRNSMPKLGRTMIYVEAENSSQNDKSSLAVSSTLELDKSTDENDHSFDDRLNTTRSFSVPHNSTGEMPPSLIPGRKDHLMQDESHKDLEIVTLPSMIELLSILYSEPPIGVEISPTIVGDDRLQLFNHMHVCADCNRLKTSQGIQSLMREHRLLVMKDHYKQADRRVLCTHFALEREQKGHSTTYSWFDIESWQAGLKHKVARIYFSPSALPSKHKVVMDSWYILNGALVRPTYQVGVFTKYWLSTKI